MNVFDVIILVIIGLSCFFGFYKGSIKLIVGFVCFLGSIILTTLMFPLGEIVVLHYIKNHVLASIANGISCYIISLIVFAFISKKLVNFMGELSGNITDRVLGVFVGAIKGMFYSIFVFGIIAIFTTDSYVKVANAKEMMDKVDSSHYPSWLVESYFYPFLTNTILNVREVLPMECINLWLKSIELSKPLSVEKHTDKIFIDTLESELSQ